MPDPAVAARASSPEDWLEIIEADSPLLLIAPHGGRAEPRTRAILHPKVNDLHTADITRELAGRVGAAALINHAMDRNRLDCNRIGQVCESAPWLLEMIDERLRQIVERHGHATVLLIHGWNIIEPRVDLGLGLKLLGGELRPPGAAHVSASDDFIRGPLADFATRLRERGIKPSFGMRYPAGGAQNLLQAFTRRHRESTVATLRSIAEVAEAGTVDAVQLEFSVACRLPGPLREHCVAAMEAAFAPSYWNTANGESAGAPIIRAPRPKLVSSAPKTPAPQPTRVGIEFYDPKARIGAMASFDLGAGGFGGRIMMLLGARRVALFTGEGRVERTQLGIALGPLHLDQRGDALELSFDGAAVIVPDSTEYLSIERALASGRLDPALRVGVRVNSLSAPLELASIVTLAKDPARLANIATFGALDGEIVVEGASYPLRGHARAGVSFTGLGPTKFSARRMAWVCFGDGTALEVRRTTSDEGEEHRTARVMSDGEWREHELRSLTLDTPMVESPPHRMEAELVAPDASTLSLVGWPESFIPLSRPGPDGSRIYTALGFANFSIGDQFGAGMFEFSRRAVSVMTADASDEGDDTE